MKRLTAGAFSVALLLCLGARATTIEVKVLLDTDGRPRTGCRVPTAAGFFDGVDQVITTTVGVRGGTATVTGVALQSCAAPFSSLLGASTPIDGGWPAGVTPAGDLLVETHVPNSDLPLSGSIIRLGFVATSDGEIEDAILHTASGGDILLPARSGRRRAVNADPLRRIRLDGVGDDWDGISSLAGDSDGNPALRIEDVRAVAGTTDMFFRIDLQSNRNAPTARSDDYTLAAGGATLNITAPGVLANDTDPNSLPLTAQLMTGPQHGALTLEADGSFTYINDDSNSPADSFRYKAFNGTLMSNAGAVRITIGTAPPADSRLPLFTSPAAATFRTAISETFLITTAGHPTASISLTSGSLPSAVTFHDNGDGTATLAGIAPTGTGGVYHLVFTATNSHGSTGQNFTLEVHQAPQITSGNSATFTAGTAGTFTVLATGFPAPAIAESGALPSGVTYDPATHILAGTPGAGSGGVYSIVFTASNAAGDAPQTFTLTVNEAPAITAAPMNTTVCAGATAAFNAAASGFPVPAVQWKVSADGGATFADISGATSGMLSFPASVEQSGNLYRAVFTNTLGTTQTTAALTVYAPPAITLDPLPQTVCAGSPATFTAAASSNASAQTVQWEVSTNGGTIWTPIPGATSNTLSFTSVAADNGHQYRAMFTDACGSTPTSAAILTVDTLPVISANPGNITVCAGASASFTASATSNASDHTVAWEVSTNGGSTWNPIPGAFSTTLSFTTTAADSGKQYRAVFTTACGSTASNSATLTVSTAPAITANPGNTTVCEYTTASFVALAGGSPTVQWQVSVNGGTTFTDIAGATSTTLSFTATSSDSGHLFRAVFSNACGTATGTAATLTVSTAPAVTTNPVNQAACAGATATFTAAASGSPTPTIQWQVSTDGTTFADIPGATSPTLSFTTVAGDDGHRFRARFSNICGTDVVSNAATLTVDTLPVVITNPLNQTVCGGASVSFTAAASSNAGDHTVQWEVSTNGGSTWSPIPGATSTTLTFFTAAGDNGHKFHAVFTDACGSVTSTAATLTVDTLPSVIANPGSTAVCASTTAAFAASAISNAGDHTVQWEVSANGGSTWNAIPGETTTALSFTATGGDNGHLFRAVFTDACGSTATTAAALTVYTAPAITANPSDTTVCESTTASFAASAGGNPAPTVQWQVSVNGGTTFTDIPGATSTTLSFSAISSDSGHLFRAVFTGACGTATSTAATLTVSTAPAVTTSPLTQTVVAGDNVTLTAAASGSPSPTVQWQVSVASGPFTDISGATSASYNFTPQLGDNGNQYRAVFTNACDTATTAAATLTVTCPVLTFTPNGTMPAATYHTAYSQNIGISGGSAPYTLALANATNVPSGFSFTDNGNGTATVASANVGVTGSFTFDVLAMDSGGCTTTLTFTLTAAPRVVTDTYAASGGNAGTRDSVGNTEAVGGGATPTTPIVLSYSAGVLANDDAPAGTLSVTTPSVTNTAGTITFTGAGAWDYQPAAGFTGTASFDFNLSSNGATATGTINIAVSNKVWYVRNDFGAGGSGTSASPFNTLAAAEAASAAGDIIYVMTGDGTTTGQDAGIELKANQHLIGAGAALVVDSYTLASAGTKPRITNTAPTSDAITLADGNTVKGLTIASATRDGIAGNGKAGFTGDALTIESNASSGLHLTSMTGAVTVTHSTISSGTGVALTVGSSPIPQQGAAGDGGTASITLDDTNSITAGPGQRSALIQNRPAAAGDITIAATIDDTGGGIAVHGNASGTIAFTGTQTLSTGANTAVALTMNSGAIVNFAGALSITTSTGSGFTASGGGTLNVLGTANVTTEAAEAGVKLTGMTVGGSGVTFNDVSTTGATNGIFITSSIGTVTVNGGTISGGTTGIYLAGGASTSLSVSDVTVTGATMGISGSNFGTLTIGSAVSVSAATALSLDRGAVSGTFADLSSTGGTNGVSLTSVTGTWGAPAGSLTGASGATFNLSGGSGTISWGTTISQSSGAAAVNVSSSGASVTFSGDITTSGSSTGLVFAGANGSYTFSGTNGLGGVNAVTIGSSSTGSFTFGAGTSVSNTTGTAVQISGTTPVVLFQGSISQTANAQKSVVITGVTGGSTGGVATPNSIRFTGSINQTTAQTAIDINNNSGGNIAFANSALSLSTGTAGAISMVTNAGATISFPSVLSVTTSTGNGIAASGGGILTLNGSVNATAGQALNLSGGTLNAGAMSSVSSGGGATGILLSGVTGGGTLTISAGSLSGNTGSAFKVLNGTASISYAGSITQNTSSQKAVEISGITGGTISLSGPITSNGGAGVSIAGTGGTVTISGGMTLNGTASVFSVTGGGMTVNVTGTNTVGGTTAATTTAVNITSTIGGSGVTFRKVSSSGATSGIILSNTGAGAFTITGNAGTCSSAATCTGGAIQSSTGPGMTFTSTGAISLTNVDVEGGADDGIRGSNVNGFTLTGSRVVNNGNATTERGIDMVNLTGSGAITNCTVTGNAEDNLWIQDTGGTLASSGSPFAITGSTFSNTSTTVGNDGIRIEGLSNANMNVSITGCTFNHNRGDHFQVTTDAVSSATINATFSTNTLTGDRGTTYGGTDLGGSITINPGGTANVTVTLSNNNITGAVSSAITLDSSNSSQIHGTISGNSIGTAGTADSGSSQGDGISIFAINNSALYALVQNNIIRQYSNLAGIDIRQNSGSASVQATVTGNTISNPGTFAAQAVLVTAGSATGDSGTMCLDLGGAGALANGFAGMGAGGTTDFRVRQRMATTVRLPGYAGSNSDTAAVVAFISGRNTGAPSGSATTNLSPSGSDGAPFGGGFTGGAASCVAP